MKFQQLELIKADLEDKGFLYKDFEILSNLEDRTVYYNDDTWLRRILIIEMNNLNLKDTEKAIDLLDGNKYDNITYRVYDCEAVILEIRFDKSLYNIEK